MDFVCLAAGQGTRFGRLGTYLQKCMYPIGARPFVEYTFEQLRDTGLCRSLTVVIGWRVDQVRSYFGDDYEGIPLRYVVQETPLGTADAAARALEALPDPTRWVVVWLADTFVSQQDFAAIAVGHRSSAAMLLADPGLDANAAIRVTLRADGTVEECWHGAGPLVDRGLWRVPGSLFSRPQDRGTGPVEARMLRVLSSSIADGLVVDGVVSDEWVHLGSTYPSVEDNLRAVTDRLLTAPERARPAR